MTSDADAIIDKRALEPRFRERLTEVIARSGLSKAAFAARIGVDRSALSQLLSSKEPRLPRAETLVAIARSAEVSLDWLLGLSEDDTLATEVAEEVAIEERAGDADDPRIIAWRREAQGAKIRYVPAFLPDLLRLPAIAAQEHRGATDPRIQSRVQTDRETLALSRMPETDMEVCLPRQRIDLLASGDGVYAGLSRGMRRAQLDHMAELVDELYPSFRLFLYDEAAIFSAPYTVFGLRRAALYVGEMYLVLNARSHIQALAQHFDRLIRGAEIDAREAADFLRLSSERVR